MTPRRRLRAGAVVIVAGLAAGAQPRAIQSVAPTFRAGIDLVRVDVSVRQADRPVTGLQAKDFEVLDNGVPQDVLDVSYEKLPIDVTVALDVSQSVTGAVLDRMRRGVGQLKADLGANDRLKLLAFNMRVKRLTDFTAGGIGTDSALAQVTAYGTTSLYDTLAVSLMARPAVDRRQLVVVFSDGVDSSSVTAPETLVDLAKSASVTTAFVLPPLTSPILTSAAAAGRDLYKILATQTGGTVVVMLPKDDLGPTFRRVLEEFRSSYVLHFTPRGVESGGVHALDVHVSRRDAEVRARKAYGGRAPVGEAPRQ